MGKHVSKYTTDKDGLQHCPNGCGTKSVKIGAHIR